MAKTPAKASAKTTTKSAKPASSPGKATDKTAQLTARLQACYTGAVHDVLRGMGHERIVLPPEIKAIAPGTRVAGPVWTVSGHIDRSLSRHDTLLGWCTLLSKTPSGHVVICQPQNHEVALMGELSAQTLKARGVLGYIVDGGSRDTDLVLEEGFPVFCSFLTPSDIVQRWIPGPLRRSRSRLARSPSAPATGCWPTVTVSSSFPARSSKRSSPRPRKWSAPSPPCARP